MKSKNGFVVLLVIVSTFVVVATLAAAFAVSLRLHQANVRMQDELLPAHPTPKAEEAQAQQSDGGGLGNGGGQLQPERIGDQ